MRETREILRQKWLLKWTHREVAASVGVSAGVVGLAMRRAADAKLDWAGVESIDDVELERRLYPGVGPSPSVQGRTARGFIASGTASA